MSNTDRMESLHSYIHNNWGRSMVSLQFQGSMYSYVGKAEHVVHPHAHASTK
jgi:hypothetical protein